MPTLCEEQRDIAVRVPFFRVDHSIIIALTMLVAARAQAQQPTIDSASALGVGAAFLAAVTRARWNDAARYLELSGLDAARKERVDAEKRRRASRPITIQQLMRANPHMPRSVAAYQLKQMAEQRRSVNYLFWEFGVADPDSLLALSIEAVARRWVEVHDQRWQNRQIHRGCGHADRDDELPAPTYHIISAATEDARAYMLFADTAWQSGRSPVYAPPPRVMQLRRTAQGWRILPRVDLIGLPEMVNACG